MSYERKTRDDYEAWTPFYLVSDNRPTHLFDLKSGVEYQVVLTADSMLLKARNNTYKNLGLPDKGE